MFQIIYQKKIQNNKLKGRWIKKYLEQEIKEIEYKEYSKVSLIAWSLALAFIRKYECKEKDKLPEFFIWIYWPELLKNYGVIL